MHITHSADYYGIPLYLHTNYFFYDIFHLASIK